LLNQLADRIITVERIRKTLDHPMLGTPMRAIGGGKAVIGSNVKVAAAGAILDVPLDHKDDSWSFPHFDTITVSVADAPRPDEIVVVTAIADGGRLRNQCGTEPIPIGATRTSCGCTRIPSDPEVRL
jgi:Amino acid synthesis